MKPDLNNLTSTRDVLQHAECVYDNVQIETALDRQAKRLNARLQHVQPLVLCVMQGGLVYTANLVRRLDCLLELDYLHATRYRNRLLGRDLQWLARPATALQGRTVLVLDDILDEGHTLAAIIEYCESMGADQVLAAVLLLKEHERRGTEVTLAEDGIDYALTVPDRYVFGYGMDIEGKCRQLDCIYALKGNSNDS